jgi:RND superfamily putative drug exporter
MKTRIIQNEPEEPANNPSTDGAAVGEPRRNLAARMGRWSATHKKIAIFGWFALLVVAFMVGKAVGTKNLDPQKSGSGESGHVDSVLADHFKQAQGDTVLFQSTAKIIDDAAFRAAVTDVARTVRGLKQTKKIESPLADDNKDQISNDRHSALLRFELRTTDLEKAKTLDGPVEKALAAAATRHPGIAIEEFGVNAEKQIDDAVVSDFKKAGVFSVPLTLAVLIVAFGALVAAGLPLLLALTAVFITISLLALPSHLIPLDKDISVIVLLIGLAVGVDYSMFYLKRERQERAAGRSEGAALEVAAATSGRAVLVSGLTVMIAMAGMLFTGDKTFVGFGVATIIVVAVAVLGSLTVLPATLAALGDKVDKGRVPFLSKRRRADGEGRVWSAILDRVLRRPLLSTFIAGGLLLLIAAPALNLRIKSPGTDTLPQNLSAVKTYNKLQKAFPGDTNSVQVMVRTGNARSPAVRKQISYLQDAAISSGQFFFPTNVDYSPDGKIALVSLDMQGEGTDSKSLAALQALRERIVPATVGKLDDADVGVTGGPAADRDSNAQLKEATPFVFAFVLTLAFLLMLLTFRSLVIAAKTVLLNLLSVAAAYGVLVLVFQDGWAKGLLGFSVAPGGIIGFLPIFLFVILFGLSMDYHVFILSRVREGYDRGMPTEEAVAHGIKSTAGVVTSAALVMFGVFAIFGTLQFMFLKEFGVGLAVAVLLDATIVRAVLLPAMMKLLGDWNWYLPSWLEWLPHIEHGERAEHVDAPAALGPTA